MRNRKSRVARSGKAAIARMTDQDEPIIITLWLHPLSPATHRPRCRRSSKVIGCLQKLSVTKCWDDNRNAQFRILDHRAGKRFLTRSLVKDDLKRVTSLERHQILSSEGLINEMRTPKADATFDASDRRVRL